jgi:hypothetical protein
MRQTSHPGLHNGPEIYEKAGAKHKKHPIANIQNKCKEKKKEKRNGKRT